MSRSKYWYQPLYCPPGGWLKREKSELSSSSCGPSFDIMNASAIFGQAASMIAAPGCVDLAVEVPIQPAAAVLPPGDQQRDHLRRLRFGAASAASSRCSSGTVSIARTSWVAAAFIAAVTEASDHLPSFPFRRREVVVQQVHPGG